MNNSLHFWLRINLLLVLGLALAGCGKNGGMGTASFDQAPPAIKADWDKAVAADQANDYVTATAAYQDILRQQDQLSRAQVQRVEDAKSKLFQRLVEASQKGDPAARQALSKLGSMNRQVPP